MIMEIERFAEIVKDGVIKRLGDGCQVTIQKVDKNNGVTYTGLNIRRGIADIAPLIYLDSQYRNFKNGRTTIPEVVDYVVRNGKIRTGQVDMRKFLNYERVADTIVYRLVNTRRNEELLEDLPHIEFMDLSIVFQCMLDDEVYGTAFILIHNVHLKLWSVTVNDLLHAAEKNTPLLMGYEFKSMKDVLFEIMESELPEETDHDMCMAEIEVGVPMYVLSNQYRVDGAACILYPTLLADICDRLESSFYLIPSSVHEVLILPSDNTDDSTKIREMIKEVNDTQVAAEDLLSYSLYFYDRKESRLQIV